MHSDQNRLGLMSGSGCSTSLSSSPLRVSHTPRRALNRSYPLLSRSMRACCPRACQWIIAGMAVRIAMIHRSLQRIESERETTESRDITGALNGGRFVEQPHIRKEVEDTLAFCVRSGTSPR